MEEYEYLMDALHCFNTDVPNWYGWKTHDDDGNKIEATLECCSNSSVVGPITIATGPFEAKVFLHLCKIGSKNDIVFPEPV